MLGCLVVLLPGSAARTSPATEVCSAERGDAAHEPDRAPPCNMGRAILGPYRPFEPVSVRLLERVGSQGWACEDGLAKPQGRQWVFVLQMP